MRSYPWPVAPRKSAADSLVASALAERGQAPFLTRACERDVIAWIRLLVDPHDASAVVRALARPPIELRQVHLARVIQLARRRRLDLVAGLHVALEAPQVPPEACERIERFISIHDNARAALEEAPSGAFVERLIELLGTRERPLLSGPQALEHEAGLERLNALAGEYTLREPHATARELAEHLARTARAPVVRAEADRGPASATGALEDGEEHSVESGARAGAGALEVALQLMREEVLEGVERIGGRLGELRLDTELDIAHGVVRYLELLKLAALLRGGPGRTISEALADINARLLAATTPIEREIFLTSTLDDTLMAAYGERSDPADPDVGADLAERERHERVLARAVAPREEASLGPFLPRRGIGLALSASDVETYRSCPLRYKFARVLRIPTAQTPQQRFGIAVHQVLERFHADGSQTLARLLELLDSGLDRAGLGETGRDRELRDKARTALRRYHAALGSGGSKPVWFERRFAFRLGPHHLRGRVDRVDRLTGEEGDSYELIDYKTSRPKTAEQLEDDVQLPLYALAAREDWKLESSRQAYYYVLDDRKVPVPARVPDHEAIRQIVLAVGEGILAQDFEPTPSVAACATCDYRIVCPAAV